MRPAQELADSLFKLCDGVQGAFTENQGPVLVPMIIDAGEFQRLHLETRAYKLNMLYLKETSHLYVQHDHSLPHEAVRAHWTLSYFAMPLEKLGIQTLGANRLVDVCPGGLVEYKDRFQQVDILIVERSPGERTADARVVLVAQVVYLNEDIDKAVADLDAVTAEENSGARIALVIQVHEGTLSVWVKERGSPLEKLDPQGVLRLDWNRLFKVPEVRGQLCDTGISEISLVAAAEHVAMFF